MICFCSTSLTQTWHIFVLKWIAASTDKWYPETLDLDGLWRNVTRYYLWYISLMFEICVILSGLFWIISLQFIVIYSISSKQKISPYFKPLRYFQIIYYMGRCNSFVFCLQLNWIFEFDWVLIHILCLLDIFIITNWPELQISFCWNVNFMDYWVLS